jgi:hemerythrin superfamily protein
MSDDIEVPGHFTKEKAGQKASRLMTQQKNRAADGLQRLAGVVRNTALTQNDFGGQTGNYRNRAAARMDSMATYMRGADFPTMLRDARRFARRPEVVLVGTVVTGLLVARFVKVRRRRATAPWRLAAGRWNDALQKGAQVVSAAADALREGAEARGLRPEAVVDSVTGSRLAKHIALIGDRIMGGNMKATTLLKNDHSAVKKLLTAFGHTTARAAQQRQELMDQIAQELEIHSAIEEEIFYPAVKSVRGGQSLVSEAKAEHKKVDSLVAEAQGMSMDTEEVMEKVEELRDAVIHHATEEEREMFPVAEDGLGEQQLEELGEQLAARKKELLTSRLQKAKRAVQKALRKIA